MRILLLAVPATVLAAAAAAQTEGGANPTEAAARVPPVEYRSVFEGYRPFEEQELANWRGANAEVGAAGGHAGHRLGQGPGEQTSKPQPGSPESAGGHGGHK